MCKRNLAHFWVGKMLLLATTRMTIVTYVKLFKSRALLRLSAQLHAAYSGNVVLVS